MYCKKCGGKVDSYASNCPFCGEPVVNNSVQATYTSAIPAQQVKTHKSPGGWILTYIITCLPVIGLIMLFVWAFGENTKKDLTFRNWAKAELILMVLATLLSILVMVALIPLVLEGLSS